MKEYLRTHQPIIYAVLLLFIISFSPMAAQNGSVQGKITDGSTGEALIGASVLIQGTTKGAVADLDGNFLLDHVADGAYNLIFSYVSYEQKIQRIEIKNGSAVNIDAKLQSASVAIGEVKVVASKRSDTEIAMINSIRNNSLVVNGISKQQISKSQDRDASEVISRVPGVTVRDGRFINVRGLDERYNVVLLNGVAAPSSESDRRAFSFDMVPSALIDNLVLYKTPAPEIPADFAGAVVQIQTKNTVDVNSTDISYATGYRQNTTFNDFYTYQGGKTDWLGFDDGTRDLPSAFPSTSEFRQLADNPSDAEKTQITELGRAFNKIWTPYQSRAIPDQAFGLTINRKFLLGNVSVGNTTAIGYSTGNQFREVFRAGYQAYNVTTDQPDISFYFNDDVYTTKTKANGLFNWLFVFGNNQKIEFRNFFNQLSDKQTILRLGRDFYGGINKAANELSFQSRSMYSGQLGGNFNFNQSLINLNWTLGYSYTNKIQPDIRRVERNQDESTGLYTLSINFNADPKMIGRLSLTNHEHIYVSSLNYSHRIQMGNLMPEIKTGLLYEQKNRDFEARNIGFAMSNGLTFNWNLMYQPIDSVFQDKNINFTDGIKVDESTDPTDSYSAGNKLFAAYAAINIPVGKLKIYTGLRLEKNDQSLEGLDRSGALYKISNDFTDLFPSLNLSYNISDKSLLRFAYGRTINRPEFREISLQSYYDFEEKATIYGNTDLQNSYLQNIDLRYEIFPENGDMLTFGGFYKHFSNPIEAHLTEAGSGRNYTFDNAESAESYGIELEIRKSFRSFENSDHVLRMLRHMVVVFNVALIKSELQTNDPNAREEARPMQGQSPYILNTGLFYDNPDMGLMISVLYNIIGERIMFVGDKDEPHIIQMPRNLIDITLNKRLGEYVTLKAGIKDLFNQPVEMMQNERIQLVPGVSDSEVKREQRTQIYKPSTGFMLGLSVNF
jgi:outer membrane cobalamin receptor